MSKMKEAAMRQQENLPAKQTATAVAVALASNPFLEVAAEGGDNVGTLLKFTKGRWKIGDEAVKEGTEYVCHLPQAMRGWIKFEGGKVTDRRIGKIADRFPMPEREELGDNDPKRWTEKDAKGEPRDPWVKQYYLPLVSVASGELVTFVTGSHGGRTAVQDLCRVYGYKARPGELPIVALQVRSYKHEHYGTIENPKFAIVGWDGAGGVSPAPSVADEMADEIPF
jgi:hypothetical protein